MSSPIVEFVLFNVIVKILRTFFKKKIKIG